MKKILFAFLCTLALKSSAQDPRFSMFHMMPLYLNPAMTGFFDGDVRFGALYRNQWFTLGSPYGNTKYETEAGAIDGRIMVGKPAGDYDRKEDYIGIGGAFLRDVAGDEAFTSTNGFLNISYSKTFGYKVKHALKIGFQGQILSTQFRNGGAVFPDGIVENIGRQNVKFDAGLGIVYQIYFERRLNMYFGFAYSHLASPDKSLMAAYTDNLYAKYTGSAGAIIAVRDKVNLVPTLMIMNQGSSIDANVGASAQYIFGDVLRSRNSFSFGLMARFTKPEGPEAVIPTVKLEYASFTAALAYDVNISNLDKGTHSVGAIEVALQYIFKHNRRMAPTSVGCPTW